MRVVSNSKIVAAAFLILSSVLTGCEHSSTSDTSDSAGSYEYTENDCGTGKQFYSSHQDLCQKLSDDDLNRNCAGDIRRIDFSNRCQGLSWPVAGTSSPMPIQPVSPVVNPPPPPPTPVTPGPTVPAPTNPGTAAAVAEVCNGFYNTNDKVNCMIKLRDANIPANVIPICNGFYNNNDKVDCLTKLNQTTVLDDLVGVCQQFYNNNDKVSCLQQLAGLYIPKDIITLCSQYYNNNDKVSCLLKFKR